MMLDLTVNLGQVISTAGSVGAIVWGVSRVSARIDESFRILDRHEYEIRDHGKRLNEHGERIAGLGPERRR